MIERTFTPSDQRDFAGLSGDRNPIHLDSRWASTVFPGVVVVHGMHALLWALDGLGIQTRPDTLMVSFLKPILLNEQVQASRSGDTVTIAVRGEPMIVGRLNGSPPNLERSPRPLDPPTDLPDYLGRPEGIVPTLETGAALCALFPRLTETLGAPAVQGLAALSTLVGMHCPGLHSMFSGFSVTFPLESDGLRYHVARYHRRFGRVSIFVRGQGLVGTIEAFSTAPTELVDVVSPHRVDSTLAGHQPLIIGGSSGLGATTAWLLAMRGASPIVTYFGSLKNAERLTSEIIAARGSCQAIRMDIRSPNAGLAALSALPWTGSQMYYFASPRIFRRRVELYQAQDLSDFVRVYVDGFYECVRGLTALCQGRSLTVFYPSSVAVERPPADLIEYAFAKHIGELLCDRMRGKFPQVNIVVERLPRVATRQTQTILKLPALSAEAAMLPIIRTVQGNV